MRAFLRQSWGLMLVLLAIFAGDRHATVPQGKLSCFQTSDSLAIRAVIDEMIFESLFWAEVGDAPPANRPIIYFDQQGNIRSLNTAPDLRQSFKGAYAIVSLDSIPKHILDLPLLKPATDNFNVMVKSN